jgi:hypothetical protein
MQPRLDRPALFSAIGYTPHAGQLAVHRSTARRRVLACGVRWGKSTCACYECVAALLEPRAEAVGWVVAPTYDLAERIFLRVRSVVQRYFPHRIKEINERERRIVVFNLAGGLSEFRAKSADNPDSLLGEGLDWVVVDEAARLKDFIWHEHLSQRLLDKAGWALLLSTPNGRDWFWKLYRRGQKNRDAAYESWASASWVNPRLNPALIEDERKRLRPEVFAETYAAEFVGEDLEPCDLCGGPDPDVRGSVMLRGRAELARCKDCGKEVDAAGHTLWRLAGGRPEFVLFRLLPRRDGTVPDIEFAAPDGEKRCGREITADDIRQVP